MKYVCSNLSCPERDPVTAATAPTCYTCARPMAEVARRPELIPEPYIYESDSFTFAPKPDGFNGIDAVFGGPAPREETFPLAAPPVVQSLFIGLHAELPGELGHELNYPGYQRQRVDRRANGQWPEQVRLEFVEGTASCVARFFGISHAESSELLYFDEIHPRIHVDIGTTPILILYPRAITELGAFKAACRLTGD